MKYTKEHLAELTQRITTLRAEYTAETWQEAIDATNYAKDKSQAFRWRCLWAVTKTPNSKHLTKGYKDVHLDTALKSAFKGIAC